MMTVSKIVYRFFKSAGEPATDSASRTASMTVFQSPNAGCLNNRASGYHGLSVRSSNHRQHVSKRFMIHTGLPIAPAR